VANDICRSAVPAPNYLPERRSTAFPHHYSAGVNSVLDAVGVLLLLRAMVLIVSSDYSLEMNQLF